MLRVRQADLRGIALAADSQSLLCTVTRSRCRVCLLLPLSALRRHSAWTAGCVVSASCSHSLLRATTRPGLPAAPADRLGTRDDRSHHLAATGDNRDPAGGSRYGRQNPIAAGGPVRWYAVLGKPRQCLFGFDGERQGLER